MSGRRTSSALTQNSSSYEDLPIKVGVLNPKENDLFWMEKLVGVRVLAAAVAAWVHTAAHYLYNQHYNGNGDAFRHACWNGLMSFAVGLEWAKRWGDAHEDVSGNPRLHKEMDLHNNSVGRSIVRANPGIRPVEIIFTTIRLVNDGTCLRLVPPKGPDSKLVRTDDTGLLIPTASLKKVRESISSR